MIDSMSIGGDFAGFTLTELADMVISLESISAPTDSLSYPEPGDIILAHLPAKLSDAERAQIKETVINSRESMQSSLSVRDRGISPEIVKKRIKLKSAYNKRTRGTAGTFREGIGDNEGPRIQITFSSDRDNYTAAEVVETLIHEYVHASSFLRGEDNSDSSNQFGRRCLNAFQEWNKRLPELTHLDENDPRVSELRANIFGHGHVYEGPIGKICDQVIKHLEREEIARRRAEYEANPAVQERRQAYPGGVPTLHRGAMGGYRSNDGRYYCERDGSEWVLVDKEQSGVESYFGTLAEAKGYVQEQYMDAWRQQRPVLSDDQDTGTPGPKPKLDQRLEVVDSQVETLGASRQIEGL
jgi:hypothetical protein